MRIIYKVVAKSMLYIHSEINCVLLPPLGVNFNIEAADDIENGTPSVYLETLPPVEVFEGEPEKSDTVTEVVDEVSGVVPSVNGVENKPSPRIKRKRQQSKRHSSPKAASTPVIKLHKLSPGTILKHTAPSPFVEPEPPAAASPVVSASSPPFENGEALVPLARKRTLNGPSLFRNKHLKKKAAKPKTAPRKKDTVKPKDEKTEPENSLVRNKSGEDESRLVECVKCSALVTISSARHHLSVCSSVTPIQEAGM